MNSKLKKNKRIPSTELVLFLLKDEVSYWTPDINQIDFSTPNLLMGSDPINCGQTARRSRASDTKETPETLAFISIRKHGTRNFGTNCPDGSKKVVQICKCRMTDSRQFAYLAELCPRICINRQNEFTLHRR